jgi:hypothetical protein
VTYIPFALEFSSLRDSHFSRNQGPAQPLTLAPHLAGFPSFFFSFPQGSSSPLPFPFPLPFFSFRSFSPSPLRVPTPLEPKLGPAIVELKLPAAATARVRSFGRLSHSHIILSSFFFFFFSRHSHWLFDQEIGWCCSCAPSLVSYIPVLVFDQSGGEYIPNTPATACSSKSGRECDSGDGRSFCGIEEKKGSEKKK